MRTRSTYALLSGRKLLVASCIVAVCTAATGCQGLMLDRNARIQGSDVLMDGGDEGRRRWSDGGVSPPLEEAWLYNAAAAFGPGSPLFVRNAVLVGNRNGELHAIELESGRKIGIMQLGESLEGPLLIQDNMAYVTNAWGKYTLTAYDLVAGEKRWRTTGANFEAAPVLESDLIIAVDVEGSLRAFDVTSGKEAWSTPLGERISGQTSPVLLGDGRVFVVTDTGMAFMVATSTGNVLWTHPVGSPVYASPAAIGDVLLIPTTRGRFVAMSAVDAAMIWEFDTGNSTVRFTSPATDGVSVFVGTSEGTVYELGAESGDILWRFDGPDAIVAPPLINDTHLFVGTMGRMLYAFERTTHDLVWEKKLKGRVKSAMAARSDYLVVLTEPRYVYSFRSEALDAATR